ncbi:MAG: flagellar hook protein [Schwartzia succinivorans]|jgi:flagellar hook-associated protein 2|nr:flagellar hook protein [Schwartzia succinivorans]
MGVNGLYGLSGSGLDIESMVKAGMLSKQNQYDKMYKKEVKNEWLKQGFNEIYTSLNTFKYSTLSDYKMSSKMNAMGAESGNSTVVKATANGDAVAMTHNVTVNSLSQNAYLMTKDSIDRAKVESYTIGDNTYTTKKENNDGSFTFSGGKNASGEAVDPVTLSSEALNGVTENKSESKSIYLKDIVFKNIQYDRTEGGVAYYTVTDAVGNTRKDVRDDEVALSFSVQDKDAAFEDDADQAKKTIHYTFGELFESKTLNDLAADIKNLNTNVTASYDATNDGFTLYNKESGSEATISLTMNSTLKAYRGEDSGKNAAALFNALGLKQSIVSKEQGETEATAKLKDIGAFAADGGKDVKGTNGNVTIDGRTYENVKDSRITVSGVTYSLANIGSTTVSVTQDTTAIIDNVKKFVEDYNKILDDLTKKYNTKPDGDYEPLSKTQEASMTQEQIDKWTEKAKSGLFYHNEILRDMIYAMRDAVSTPVQSVGSNYNSASAIGITSSNNQGHLQLDEDKLKKALAADPDCVYQIFASDQDTYTEADPKNRTNAMATDDYNHRGIANRLYFNAVTDGIKNVEDYAGVLADPEDQSTLGLLITQLKTRMDNFKALMDDFQTQLYKKYDALEVMISQMNAQYNTIFGGQQ